MTQHRHLKLVQRGDFSAHARGCKQCHKAALLMAQDEFSNMTNEEAIRYVVRKFCVAGAVVLLNWMHQETVRMA